MTTGTPWVPSRARPREVRSAAGATPARRTAARALAALVMLATTAAVYGLTVASAFALSADGLSVHGAAYTDEATVLRSLGLDSGARPNLFALDSARLAAALRAQPAIDTTRSDAVSVRVVLPNRLVVEVHERQPILAWQVGQQRFLADSQGVLMAAAEATAAPVLPTIVDVRVLAGRLHVGGQLDAVDLAVARLIGAISPALLGSAAEALEISVSDDEGYVLQPVGGTWRAVFGIYTPHGRGADLVAAQVECLTSLLHGREASVAVAYLFPEGGQCGTYTRPAATP
ncbi:MAG: cell division protein FtsQ/DivIB [Candidatus Limnocylindrales bacterium]